MVHYSNLMPLPWDRFEILSDDSSMHGLGFDTKVGQKKRPYDVALLLPIYWEAVAVQRGSGSSSVLELRDMEGLFHHHHRKSKLIKCI